MRRRRRQLYRAATQVPAPVFSAEDAPDGTTSLAYSYQYVASNSPTYALGTGSLPTGLNLSVGGLLSGTPAGAGDFTFTVVATNASGTDTTVSQAVTVITSPGTSSLTYSWTLPTDPATGVTDVTITSQKIYWDTASKAPFGGYSNSHVIADGTTTTYLIPSLVSGTPYYIAMTVTNANGESNFGTEIVATAP